jgi:hypothetical protein
VTTADLRLFGMADFGVSGFVAVCRGSLADLLEDERVLELCADARPIRLPATISKQKTLCFVMETPVEGALYSSSN